MTKNSNQGGPENVNGFSAMESNDNSLSRMHLAKPFTQPCRFRMAPDYTVIGGLIGIDMSNTQPNFIDLKKMACVARCHRASFQFAGYQPRQVKIQFSARGACVDSSLPGWVFLSASS